MRAGCLLEASKDAHVEIRARFLQVVARGVRRAGAGGALEPVDELAVDGTTYVSFDEAVEREVALGPLALDELLAGPEAAPIDIPAGRGEEELDGGAIVRTWEPLAGILAARAEPVADGVARLAVRIANLTPWAGGDREAALRRTFCSTHAVLRVTGGAFVSQTDPPARLGAAAAACRNEGCWPVLVGEPGDRSTMLASPIILEDHPRIAPESPGDLFDGGEIDQLLVLNILSLTDAEKEEMRATDPRAREILERTEALTPEQLMRLHGRLTDLRRVVP